MKTIRGINFNDEVEFDAIRLIAERFASGETFTNREYLPTSGGFLDRLQRVDTGMKFTSDSVMPSREILDVVAELDGNIEETPASKTTIIKGNVQAGLVGNVDVTNSNVTQNIEMSMTVVERDFDSLRTYLQSIGVSNSDIDELKNAVDSDPKPTNSNLGPDVGNWYGKMMAKAATGTWNVAKGVAGSLIANAIWAYYGLKQFFQ